MKVMRDLREPLKHGIVEMEDKIEVLLHEPELCPTCFRVFISLYRLTVCIDHVGLEEI